jgi:glyoxylase I family protein
MRFEHIGINVEDPPSMADWYVRHCRFRIVRGMQQEPFTHFLSDETGRVVLEIYRNRKARVPDYRERNPLEYHFALAVSDASAAKDDLVAAGAAFIEEIRLEDGSLLFMLRDPWGIPLQICQRSKPF